MSNAKLIYEIDYAVDLMSEGMHLRISYVENILAKCRTALKDQAWSTDMGAAPRDGTLIDIVANGIRYADMSFGLMCFKNEHTGIGIKPSKCSHWRRITLPGEG